MMKVAATELQQAMSDLFVEIAGYYGAAYNGFKDTTGQMSPS